MARYDAYILRIWRSTRADGCQWRCRIEHLPRGEQRQFTNPESLLTYLHTLADQHGMPATHSVQDRSLAGEESAATLPPGTEETPGRREGRGQRRKRADR